MKFKNWTVGEFVAYLTGNALYGKTDFFLPADLRGSKGLISGEVEIKANTKERQADIIKINKEQNEIRRMRVESEGEQ